jgi:hypothetical protein
MDGLALETSHQIFLARFYQGMIGIGSAGGTEYLIVKHRQILPGRVLKLPANNRLRDNRASMQVIEFKGKIF